MDKQKILVVDDRRENLVAMSQVLSHLEADIITAESGEQALRTLLQHKVALILLDVMMPGMNGFEVAELMRTNKDFEATPIIFVTAIGKEEQHILKGYNVGAIDYIFKPFDPHILICKVKVMLDLNQRQELLHESLAEQAQSQQTIRALLDAQLDLAVLISSKGKVQALNHSALEQLEPTVDEDTLIGKPIFDYLPGSMTSAVKPKFDLVLSTQEAQRFELHRQHTLFDVHLFPVTNEETGIDRLAMFARDITAERQNEERLVQLANYDSLTGLNNRAVFKSYQNKVLARVSRYQGMVAVLFVDLDNFKEVNDTLGHDMGDLLLKSVAGRLIKCARESDMVARLGGDEFGLILEGLETPAQSATVAQKILDSVALPHTLEGHEVHIGCSIGIAWYPDSGTSCEELNKAADTAMYRAKHQGRNTYRFYDPSMQMQNLARVNMLNGLRTALANHEFFICYQPKVCAQTEEVCGFEALLRWKMADGNVINPGSFIPLAEETGLIGQIGEWVLRTACEEVNQWKLDQGERLTIAVNVSPKQLKRLNFHHVVKHVLEDIGLAPECLEIELTESSIMEDADTSIEILDQIRRLGVSIAIDDFGTGYSSLSYLRRLPIDTVKIDLSFVRAIGQDGENESIVLAILALAKSLGLATVAEGVETPEQAAFLKKHGCHYLQGFYYGKPQRLSAMIADGVECE